MFRIYFCFLLLLPITTAFAAEPDFKTLFDGSSLNGWKQSGNWVIQDDKSVHRTGSGGSLTYIGQKLPDDFELRFEWKVASGANSGVYYRPGQYEYQILHNQVHRDGKNPRTSAASLYFCMAPSHDATRPVGEWNTARVICKGSVIQHWLNGKKVIDFDYQDKRWAFNVELLKKRGAELNSRGAHLSLQDHGDPVWYRKIKVRELSTNEDIQHNTVTPETIKAEVLEAERIKLEGILERRRQSANK
tara:strand:- start:816 stop:1553 length:738 start_codon:yes stop_codon:yes gene_type:complete